MKLAVHKKKTFGCAIFLQKSRGSYKRGIQKELKKGSKFSRIRDMPIFQLWAVYQMEPYKIDFRFDLRPMEVILKLDIFRVDLFRPKGSNRPGG